MKILQLSKSLHRGGVEDHILTLSQKLIQDGNQVIVAADNLLEKEAFEHVHIQVEQIDFLKKNPIAVIRNLKKLKNIILQNEIDVIHCHWRICAFYIEWLRRLGLADVAYVWTNHLAVIGSGRLLRNNTYFGKKVIAVSTDCKNMLMSKYGIDEKNIRLVYNGISLQRYVKPDMDGQEQLRKKYCVEDKFAVTMLCRLEPIKNHSCMLEAMNIIVNQYGVRQIKCLIAGSGTDEYKTVLKGIVDKYQLQEYVAFTGQVDPVELLSISNVMVLPSQKEGFPVSVLEAFAMKVPVIRTRTGGYVDVEGLCLDMDFDSAEQLAERVMRLMRTEETDSAMIEKAYAFVRNECTDDIMTKRIESIYQEAAWGQ